MRLNHITLKHSLTGSIEATVKSQGIEKTFVQLQVYLLIDRESGRSDNSLLGGNSELEPPVPIPNTEVKRLSADDSVAIAM